MPAWVRRCGQPRLQEEQQAGGGDQHRDDRFEGGVGGEQQRRRPGDGADQHRHQEADEALALLAQQVAVAEDAADVAGDDPDRVGDVGRERR